MNLKTFAFGALLAVVSAVPYRPASAQDALGADPVNLPPADFSGRQFVDNSGCVFVRAGVDGNVTWVPRVTRSRQHICGQRPSFGETAVAAAPSAPDRAAPRVAAPSEPAASPSPERAAPRSRPATTAASPATPPRREPARSTRRAPASKPQAASPPRVMRRVPTTPSQGAGNRAMRLDSEQCRYGWVYRDVNGVRKALNCRPASEVRGSLRAPGMTPEPQPGFRGGADARAVTARTRIVPRHVYEQRVRLHSAVPAGYRPAWEDGRLNPHRAWQTVGGYDDTQKVWTNRVPRQRIVEPRRWWQARHEVKDPAIAYRATSREHARTTARAGEEHRHPVVSTRSVPAKPVARYVEIGVFTTPAKAQQAVSRLAAAGLPVRHGPHRGMTRVRVGPYGDGAALRTALRHVHGTGYVQAYLQ